MSDQQHDILLKEALELSRAGRLDDHYEKVWELQQLGSDEVFQACKILCSTGDDVERSLGADILGQLGGGGDKSPFRDKSIPILSKLLQVDDPGVLNSVIVALSHLNAENTLIVHRHLAKHPTPNVRLSMASALGSIDSDKAIRVLIRLSRDQDDDVRNWATFGLGQLCKRNTKAIRQALLERIDDPDEDARFEAFIGMERRQMPEVIPAMIRDLNQGNDCAAAIEAAAQVASPELIPALTRLLAENAGDEEIEFALKCCQESEE